MDRRLLGLVSDAPRIIALPVGAGLLVAAATVVQMSLLSSIVAGAFVDGEKLPVLVGPLLLLVGVAGLRASLLWLREVTARRGGIRVKTELRRRLFEHLARLGPTYVRGERTGELTATVTDGTERMDAYFSRYLPQVALVGLTPLLIGGYVALIDWPSALILFLTVPVIPMLMVLVGSYTEVQTRRQWLALSRLSASFLDILGGLRTIKLFNREDAEREKLRLASEEYRTRTMRALRYAFLSGLVLEFMTMAAIALLAVTLGVRLSSGGLPFENAFLVLLLAPEFYRPLRELGTARHAALEGRAAGERILEILDTPPPVRPRGQMAFPNVGAGYPLGVRACPRARPLSVELDRLSYTYPGAERPALHEVSLVLRAGTRTALVGRSGSGKSTLVNLLMGFFDPTSGSVIANGVPVTDIPSESWREVVALVPQRPHLFNGTLIENIRLSRPAASVEKVERAATLAGVAGFVEGLPRGYSTQVGERGARLSSGQAQRVAIARAFLKDTPLLVLDEPTSALDPESEQDIREALERLMADRTVLVVAHRLNTVRDAGQIIVLEGGGVVETGTHGELLEHGGAYARLVRASGVGVS